MKICILDRDGTINADSTEYIKSPQEWEPLPGALEAIAKLNHAGWHVVVVTNQSGLGRGLFDVATLNAMHTKMHTMLAAVGGRVDAIFYCPHAPDEGCRCRKPEPGLFGDALRRMAGKPSTLAAAAVLWMKRRRVKDCGVWVLFMGLGRSCG